MRVLPGTHARSVGWLVVACVLLAACNNFSLTGLLDTPVQVGSSTLTLQPSTVNVPAGGIRQFTASGGAGGYSYAIQPGGAGGAIDQSGLYTAPASAGTDSVTVTDSAGAVCEATAQVTFTVPLSISPASTTASAGGTAVFTASGGSGSYAWSKVTGDGTLAASTYTAPWKAETATIRVTDQLTGDWRDATVTVEPPTPVQISPPVVSLAAHGSVTFTATGGTGIYLYSLVGPGTLALSKYTAPWSADSATVEVKDTLTNSTSQAQITIGAPPALQITPATVDINDTGSVTFTATGGSGSYAYTLQQGPGTVSLATYTPQIGVPGVAVIRVTDANTGQWADATVNVSVPVALTISPKTVTVDAGGTVAFSAGGGSGGYSFALLSGSGSMSGNTYSAPMSATTAVIQVRDSLGNTDSATVTVTPPPLAISPVSTTINGGGTVTFAGSGGSGDARSYAWALMSGGGTLTGATYTAPLTATTAVIRLTDALTSQWIEATVNVTPLPPLTIAPSSANLFAGDPITFTPGGGSGSYSVSLVSGSGTLAGYTYTPVSKETAVIRLRDIVTQYTQDAVVNVFLPLTVIPATAVVQAGGTYTFSASGGKPPYTYSVAAGSGTINPSTGLFAAPAAPDIGTIKVTDSLSNASTAKVTITAVIGGWKIVSIDTAWKSGQFASLALDGSGQPRIAYYESQARELRLATNSGGWSWATVDTAGRIGKYSSLALMAGTGYPRIAYYDVGNHNLDYIAWNGSSWGTVQVVDSAGDVGMYASLALDSGGNPRIAYYDRTNKALKYAAWDGSAWNIQTIPNPGSNDAGMYCSLALQAGTSYPRVSYYDNQNKDLRYASWNGSSWTVQTVDAAGDVGMYSSLALDPATGYARISYYDNTGSKGLKFAWWNGSAWIIPPDVDSGNVGTYSSLALKPVSSAPGISYYDSQNKQLKYVDASWSGSGWIWTSPQVADSGSGNNVGQFTSLRFDAAGTPCIAYYDQAAQDLKFARQ